MESFALPGKKRSGEALVDHRKTSPPTNEDVTNRFPRNECIGKKNLIDVCVKNLRIRSFGTVAAPVL